LATISSISAGPEAFPSTLCVSGTHFVDLAVARGLEIDETVVPSLPYPAALDVRRA
jgi:hypothetical protein